MKSRKSSAALFFYLAIAALAIALVVIGQLRIADAAPATAQARFYVTIEGTKQGKFKGEGSGRVNSDKIVGVKFFYEVIAPRDPATGLPTGKRQHRPLVITKDWGAASPQLFAALVSNEVLKTVVCEFVRPNSVGQEQVYETIKLTNASISDIKRYTDTESGREVEDVAFTFQKIEIQDGTATAGDDWMR